MDLIQRSNGAVAMTAIGSAIDKLLQQRFQPEGGMLFVHDVPNKYLNMDTIRNSMYEKDPLSIFMFLENHDYVLSPDSDIPDETEE
ncbi:MAG: hypothetical protein LBV09_02065 [Deferribacteraceae bacterium]|nr:hypothetical protein [Deferribacteraceae bacterium]